MRKWRKQNPEPTIELDTPDVSVIYLEDATIDLGDEEHDEFRRKIADAVGKFAKQ